jgi:aspartyl-tRNA(Asn)/glutamyl-tRNA(Gln) amidotransferase subunit A
MNLPLTITELHKNLIDKKYSVRELTTFQLERISKTDKDINAFITVTGELAGKKAQELDNILSEKGEKAFRDQPLFGVTVGYKDLYLTKGVKTTAASKVLENYIPQYSASVVERLEAAGTVMLGKNNCDAWAHGASGENSDFAATRNPWNRECVPGGSSSGPAAAVAAGMVHLGMGTDTGGSVRQPASFCNLVGFKPTYGSVPRYGVIAMASSLDSMGHFTKSVADSKRVYEVTRGKDLYDATIKEDMKNSSDSFTLGIPEEYFVEGVDKQVEKIVYEAIELYKSLGVKIKKVSLPHTKYAISVYYIVQPAEVSSNLGRFDAIRYGHKRNAFGDEAKRRIMLGTYVLSAGYYDAYYLKAQKVRTLLISDFNEVFKDVDALIAPVSPTPPFKLGEKADDPLKMYLADVLTVAGSLAGIPGLAVPAGFTREGLPVGFQLMGPRFSENVLFDLGKLYQNETEWHKRVPNIGE